VLLVFHLVCALTLESAQRALRYAPKSVLSNREVCLRFVLDCRAILVGTILCSLSACMSQVRARRGILFPRAARLSCASNVTARSHALHAVVEAGYLLCSFSPHVCLVFRLWMCFRSLLRVASSPMIIAAVGVTYKSRVFWSFSLGVWNFSPGVPFPTSTSKFA
jgi:hypothetical protein